MFQMEWLQKEGGHYDDKDNKKLRERLEASRHGDIVSNGEYDFQSGINQLCIIIIKNT